VEILLRKELLRSAAFELRSMCIASICSREKEVVAVWRSHVRAKPSSVSHFQNFCRQGQLQSTGPPSRSLTSKTVTHGTDGDSRCGDCGGQPGRSARRSVERSRRLLVGWQNRQSAHGASSMGPRENMCTIQFHTDIIATDTSSTPSLVVQKQAAVTVTFAAIQQHRAPSCEFS
jgi:hypothetical protein